MVHSQVYEYFKQCLPEQEKMVTAYFPNGKNSIRVRQTNGNDFIFSVESPKAWRFETVDRFISDMKGGKKHG